MAGKLAKQDSQRSAPSGQSLRIFLGWKSRVTSDEALRLADEAGVVIASNSRLGQILYAVDESGIDLRKPIFGGLPCWSGTYAGYVEPGRTFREGGERMSPFGDASRFAIVCRDPPGGSGRRYIFPIPRIFEDEHDAVLVAEHPHYRIIHDGNDRIVDAPWTDVVRGFPAQNGSRAQDPKYGIPCGNAGSSDYRARFWRIGKRVGPVIRADCRTSDFDAYRVNLADSPSWHFGVVIDCPSEPVPGSTARKGGPYR